MKRVRISDVQPGRRFARALFSPDGQRLLNADSEITARRLEALRQLGHAEVMEAEDLEELAAAGLVGRFNGSDLSVGGSTDQPVISQKGQVVIESNEPVERHQIDALQAVDQAYVPARRAAPLAERIIMSDTVADELQELAVDLERRVAPDPEHGSSGAAEAVSWPSPTELEGIRQEAVQCLHHAYAQMQSGLDVDADRLRSIASYLADLARCHPTRFVQLALLAPRRGDYLPDHAYTTAVLATAVADQLRWPRQAVEQAGLAGLVFDVGMLLIPERIRRSGTGLGPADRSRMEHHPIDSVALIQSTLPIAPIVQLAALQHHERESGLGYPHRDRRGQICDLARVLAVADTFAAATEPRPYRPSKLPYLAMEETLRSSSTEALWSPAVRGLLQAVGLFPVGSFVKLSSGQIAQVTEASPRQTDRPTVQPLAVASEATRAPLNLALPEHQDLVVVRAVEGPLPAAQNAA